MAGVHSIRCSRDVAASAVDLAASGVRVPIELSLASANVIAITPDNRVANAGAVDFTTVGRVVPTEHQTLLNQLRWQLHHGSIEWSGHLPMYQRLRVEFRDFEMRSAV